MLFVLIFPIIFKAKKSKKKQVSGEYILSQFYAVQPSFLNRRSKPNKERMFNGFTLHMLERDKPNVYKHKTVVFNHPHQDTCKEWIEQISSLMPCKSSLNAV
jgi:hypothetical protein